jgi:hypothetical protein
MHGPPRYDFVAPGKYVSFPIIWDSNRKRSPAGRTTPPPCPAHSPALVSYVDVVGRGRDGKLRVPCLLWHA